MIAAARLIKLRTADGFVEAGNTVTIGRMYLVDISSIHDAHMKHEPTNTRHTKEIINVIDVNPNDYMSWGNVGWLPTEMLQILNLKGRG